MPAKRLFLIDGMAQLYRAHFAFIRNPLFTSGGENVSAVFGFTNMLMSLISRENPDLLAIVYDTSEPTFRHKKYPEYKATREKMPDDLVAQLPRLDEVIDALRIQKLLLPGYEADDLIGTISERAAAEGYEVYLVTGDKDYYQLVHDNVYFYDTKKGLDNAQALGPQEVAEVFGAPPERVVDVLALAGDKSDNVPGVDGIGMKGASQLVNELGSLETIYENLDQVKGKKAEYLRDQREQAELSKSLVTIDTNVPIDVDPASLKYGPWSDSRLRELLAELEFHSLFRYLDEQPGKTEDEPEDVNYTAVTTESELDKLIQLIRDAGRYAIDTETTSTNPMRAELVGISVSVKPGEAFYIPVNYFQFDDELAPIELGRHRQQMREAAQRILKQMEPILCGGPEKIAQHAKYDFLVLRRHGFDCYPLAFDPMLADYLLNPHQRSHGLDTLSLNYLKLKKIETKDLIGKGKAQIPMDDVPLKQITSYASEDADVTLRLAKVLEKEISNAGLADLLNDVEIPLSNVLMKMEERGVRIDTQYLADMSETMRAQIADLELECHEMVGTEFNVASPKQLGHILFEKLQFPTSVTRKTKTGYSTDQAVLEKLTAMNLIPPIAGKVLEYRELTKLVGTYIDALPLLVHPETGRVHTSYHQTVASTGRLSSSDPNLQNIPIRTELGSRIRRAFIAAEGTSLLSADYSQIELRMMAHLSEDEALIEAFKQGQDIHSATASKIFHKAIDEISREERSAVKQVNFGVLFGMREYGLSQRMGISVQEAREFIDEYFGAFPKVKEFIDNLLTKAKQDGLVTTILGRRRPMPELAANNMNIVQQGERIAIATAVQGSAADLIKLAMLKLDRDIESDSRPYAMLMQVHDELVFEVPQGMEEEAAEYIKQRMESAMTLKAPVVAEAGWGTNWLDAH